MKPNYDIMARLRNKAFWLALVPALLLLAQVVAAPFGYEWDFALLNQQATAIINAAFALLSVLGICADTSTPGFGDAPKEEGGEE